jgi:26S proteasome regulatory subunit N3
MLVTDIREHIRHIEKAINTKEPRFMSRVMRALVNTRRKISPLILRRLLNAYLTAADSASSKEELLQYLVDVSHN